MNPGSPLIQSKSKIGTGNKRTVPKPKIKEEAKMMSARGYMDVAKSVNDIINPVAPLNRRRQKARSSLYPTAAHHKI